MSTYLYIFKKFIKVLKNYRIALYMYSKLSSLSPTTT